MGKFALLIGVSEYDSDDFVNLESATQDVIALQLVLENPELGAFDLVEVLQNPSAQEFREATYWLYANRAKDDVLVFYFSGHGVIDQSRNFYFVVSETQKDRQGVIPHTAVAARDLRELMEGRVGRSKRQVVILDSCFSGAFVEGFTAKDDGNIDLKEVLGGEGRAILTSSSSTQFSFQQDDSDLSVYTQYLVEGIETGAADLSRARRASASTRCA